MNAIVPAETAARAFLQAKLLRRIAEPRDLVSLTSLAGELERDKSNTHRSLKALEEDGLIKRDPGAEHLVLELTPIGQRALLALDVAEGAAEVGGTDLLFLSHGRIRPNPLNPRTEFDEEGLVELADSIAGVDQILVPLIVFPAGADGLYTLAAGERRWRAVATLIADGRWPADRPLPCLEREEDASQAALIGLVENGQRVDLNLWDQAQAYVALMEATGWSARQCALKTGKSPRAVQEAVQVAQNADPEMVEAFKRGAVKWEDLRNGVRKPAEKTLAQLVVSDHPDDRAEFERRTSEGMARMTAENADVRAASTPAAQLNIEDVAPRRLELDVMQQLMLVEIEAAIAARPASKASLGPTVRLNSNLDVGSKRNADVVKLISEALIAVSGSWPTFVTLLPPGRQYLASMPGAFMPLEQRLTYARKAAGVSDERRAELEAEGDFVTEWLNMPKPPKPPELSDAEALILLELFDWTQRQKKDARHSGAPVRHDFDRAATKGLADRGLLYGLHHFDYADGFWRFSVGYLGPEALKVRFVDLDDASARAKHKSVLHAALGVQPPKGGNGYATPWLNGPIEPDPAFVAKRIAREEEQARAAESERQMKAARAALFNGFAKLEAELPQLTSDQAMTRLVAFQNEIGAPAPWKLETADYQTTLRVASGRTFDLYDREGQIAMRLGLMALNLISGVPPANFDFSGELTRDKFEAAIVNVVMDAVGSGEPDVDVTREYVALLAHENLDAWLAEEGISFGEDDYDWTEGGVDPIASSILTKLEASQAAEVQSEVA